MSTTDELSGGREGCLDENAIVDLLEGHLPDDARASLEAHLDGCAACRTLVAAAIATPGLERAEASSPAPEIAALSRVRAGATIARYVIVGAIGLGGMGIVYAAYDPELDRRVAVKVLRSGASTRTDVQQRRVLREAQSMARLTHPNVVAVYDVGLVDGQVFIVMEFVKGTTLRRWLAERPRSWREALDVLRRAANGLAAAHAAGLVHRDFKPDNVLIGEDGRVLVADFGLALSLAGGDDAPAEGAPTPADEADRLTRTGAVAGTPGYMSPEQLDGAVVDARSDIFAFCVTLHEALHGERPFAGETPRAIRDAIAAGRVREPTTKARVPAAVSQVILAGLRADPARRPASMSAMIDVLGRDPAAVRRRVAVVGALVLVAGLLLLGVRWQQHEQSLVCHGAERRLVGVWDPDRKEAVSSALLASGKPWAGQTFQIVEGALDRYTRDWVAMRTEACEATQITHEQSASLLDLRMRCLDDRLDEVRAVTSILAKPDDQLLTTAARAAQSISTLRRCADTEALAAPIPLPRDPAVLAEVERLRPELAKVKALKDAARYREGEALAEGVVKQARALGYAPLLAEALQIWASFLDLNARLPDAVAAFHEALWAAESGRDRRRAANILAVLVWEVGVQQGKRDLAREYADHAAALLVGLGGDPEIEVELTGNEGNLFAADGKFAEGEKLHRRELEQLKSLGNLNTPRHGMALVNLGFALSGEEKNTEALAATEQALDVLRATVGEHHPQYGATLFNAAAGLLILGRLPEAREHAERALALLEESVGPEHTAIAGAEHNLGLVANAQHRYPEAQRHLEHAIALTEKLRGPDHPYVANYLMDLAEAQRGQGRPADALVAYRRMLRIYADTDGSELSVARARSEMGMALIETGAFAEAEAVLTLALATQEKSEPARGVTGGTRLGLAMALWGKSHTTRARALALGAQAVDDLATDPSWMAVEPLARARRWLATVQASP